MYTCGPDAKLSPEELRWLVYNDANNLYGWAMSQHLPYGGYQWLVEEELPIFMDKILPSLKPDGPKGCFVEVTFESFANKSEEWLRQHNDYPLCPEVKVSPGAEPGTSVQKLILDFQRKERYVMHYRTLQFAVKQGNVVERVHRVLVFV
jgi:hypothetical protein